LEAFFPTLFHLDGALLDRFQNEFEKAVVADLPALKCEEVFRFWARPIRRSRDSISEFLRRIRESYVGDDVNKTASGKRWRFVLYQHPEIEFSEKSQCQAKLTGLAIRKIGSKSLSRSPELLHLSLFRLSLRLSAG
jgi:hypothetical protein